MTLTADLTETAARPGLTALVKTLVASHRLNCLADADYRSYQDHGGVSGFGVIKLKDSVLVFSPQGVYADIESAIALYSTEQGRA